MLVGGGLLASRLLRRVQVGEKGGHLGPGADRALERLGHRKTLPLIGRHLVAVADTESRAAESLFHLDPAAHLFEVNRVRGIGHVIIGHFERVVRHGADTHLHRAAGLDLLGGAIDRLIKFRLTLVGIQR